MKQAIFSLSILFTILTSCSHDICEDVNYSGYTFDNRISPKYTIINRVCKDDSILTSQFDNKKFYYYQNDKGLFLSFDKKRYKLSHSFVDTLNFFQNQSFWGCSYTKLICKKIYNVFGEPYAVYRYDEILCDSTGGYYSYYSPREGFIIFYHFETGLQFIKKPSGGSNKANELISLIKKDTTFYVDYKLKPIKVKLDDLLNISNEK